MGEPLAPEERPIPDPHRAIRAVLISDVCRFSTAVSRDEEPVVLRVNEDLQAFRSICEAHEGLVSEDRGDGLKMVFESPVQAAKAAVAMQERTRIRNSRRLVGDPVIEHRMGLHVGDVMVLGAKVTGHAVTIAARLEALAVPGEICFSDDVQRLIKSSTKFPRRYLGSEAVKNLEEPIKTWMTILREDVVIPPNPEFLRARREEKIRHEAVEEALRDQKPQPLWWVVLGVFLSLLVCAAAVLYVQWSAGKPLVSKRPGPVLTPKTSSIHPQGNRAVKEAPAPRGGKSRVKRSSPNDGFTSDAPGGDLSDELRQKMMDRRLECYRQYRFAEFGNWLSRKPYKGSPEAAAYREEARTLMAFRSWMDGELAATASAPLDVKDVDGLDMDVIQGYRDGRIQYKLDDSPMDKPIKDLLPSEFLSLADAIKGQFSAPDDYDHWVEVFRGAVANQDASPLGR